MLTTSILSALCLAAASAECLRVLQAVGYRPWRGYFKLYASVYFALLAAVQVAAVVLNVFWAWGRYVDLALFALLAVATNVVKRKSPLKLTKRALRIALVQVAALTVLCVFTDAAWYVWLLPVVTLVAWAVCLPLDALIAKRYIQLATRKLARANVRVIAVTGSYGKTSVKDMLAALLKDSLAPSGSCNTPLGIAAYLNKTDLSGAKYLILEFGARKRGDITQLCRLYKPFCGVITGVCAQHLSTFKTLSNVVAAKRELAEWLPPEGFCVLNSSDEIACSFASSDVGRCAKFLSRDGLTVTAEDVTFEGTRLSVTVGEQCCAVVLPQIAHYVGDVFAMCLQTALQLGQNLLTTAKNARRVVSTPHRLQLLRANGMYILDDSYNASVPGVQSCCKTLAKFHCPKVVITQGLAECGNQRRQMNTFVGKMLGEACDVAVVLGRNANYLAKGLSQTNCRVLCARNLKQAVSLAVPHAQGGILLFQNDLPDVAGM